MTLKSWIAVCMILVTCAWSAWLFGSVDWATAQKESVSADYAPDPAALSLFSVAESTEKTMRSYLQDADRVAASSPSHPTSALQPGRRNLFGRAGLPSPSTPDDDLEIIYVDPGAPRKAAKPSFPLDHFKLTGVILGPDPRAFVTDMSENKTHSLRIGDSLSGATVTAISDREITLSGPFGRVAITRGK